MDIFRIDINACLFDSNTGKRDLSLISFVTFLVQINTLRYRYCIYQHVTVWTKHILLEIIVHNPDSYL